MRVVNDQRCWFDRTRDDTSKGVLKGELGIGENVTPAGLIVGSNDVVAVVGHGDVREKTGAETQLKSDE